MIDNRIVQLQFDNSDFESNVKTTLATLEELKKGLDLDKAVDSLSSIEKGFNGIDFSGITSNLDVIADRFTFLGNLADKFRDKMSNKVISSLSKLNSALVTGPTSEGYSKYESYTSSVASIKRATGKSLGELEPYLNELIRYSDETSYSYSQMIDSVKNFINSGVDLDKSVMSIEGIGNAAGVAGISVQDASHAMTGFAKAIGAGSMKQNSWQWIKTAHMDTVQLKSEFIAAAKELGTIDKNGKAAGLSAKAAANAAAISVENFAESLHYGWLTTEVMTRVLSKYGDTTTEFGMQAYKAAQQAKTFSEMFDALKDAMSTGWLKTYQIVVGDLDEATNLWSSVANELGTVVSDFGEWRNELLQGWKDQGGRYKIIEGFQRLYSALTKIFNGIYMAFARVFGENGEITATPLLNLSEAFRVAMDSFNDWLGDLEDSNSRISRLTDAIAGVFAIIDIVGSFFHESLKALLEFISYFSPAFDLIIGETGSLGAALVSLDDKLKESGAFETFFRVILSFLKPVADGINTLLYFLVSLGHRIEYIVATNPRIMDGISKIKTKFSEFVDMLLHSEKGQKILDSILTVVVLLGEAIISVLPVAITIFAEFVNLISTLATKLNLGGALKDITGFISNFGRSVAGLGKILSIAFDSFFHMDTTDQKSPIDKLKKRFQAFGIVGTWFEAMFPNISQAIQNGINDLSTNLDWLTGDDGLIGGLFNSAKTAIKAKIAEFSGPEGVVKWVKEGLSWIWRNFGFYVASAAAEEDNPTDYGGATDNASMLISAAEQTIGITKEDTKTLKEYFEPILNTLKEWGKSIGESLGEGLKSINPQLIGEFTKLILSIVTLLKTIALIKQMTSTTKTAGKTFTKLGKLFDALSDDKKGLLSVLKNKKMIIERKSTILDVAKALALMAATIGGLIYAINYLGTNIDEKTFFNGGEKLVSIMAAVAIFMSVMSKGIGQNGGKRILLAAIGIGVLALTIKALAKTVDKLALGTDWDVFLDGSKKLAILLGMVALFSRISGSNRRFSGMWALALTILAMAKAVEMLSRIQWQKLAPATIALGGLFLAIGAMSKLTAGTKISRSIGAAILTLVAIAAMVPALIILAFVPWDKLLQGVLALGVLFLAIGAMTALSGLSSFGKIFATAILAVGTIVALTAALSILSGIETEKLQKTGETLDWLFAYLTVFTGVAGALGGVLTYLGAAVLVVGTIAAITFALVKVSELPIESVEAFGDTFLKVIGSLTAAMYVIGKMDVGGIIKGAGGLFVALAAIAAAIAFAINIISGVLDNVGDTIYIIGSNLESFNSFTENLNYETMDESLTFLWDLAYVCGQLVLVDWGVMDACATTLGRLGAGMYLYGAIIEGLSSEKVGLGRAIADEIRYIYDNLKDLSGLGAVPDYIGQIGGAVKLYYDDIAGIEFGEDGKMVDHSQIVSFFADLKENMPKGDFVDEIGGFADNSDGSKLTQFAIGLENLGTAVSKYADTIKDIDAGKVDKITVSLRAVKLLQYNMPTDFGFINVFIGQSQSLATFGTDLVVLGQAVLDYYEKVKDIPTDVVDKVTNSLEGLTAIQRGITRTKGLFQFLLGEKNLAVFGSRLKTLGTGLADYANAVKDATFDNVNKSIAPLNALADVQSKLDWSGGVWQFLFGSQDIGNFSKNFKAVGEGIASFATAVTGVDFTNIDNAVSALVAISGFYEAIGGGDKLKKINEVKSFKHITTQFSDIAVAIGKFADISRENDLSGVDAALEILDRVTEAYARMNTLSTTTMSFTTLGNDMVDFIQLMTGQSFDESILEVFATRVDLILSKIDESFQIYAKAHGDAYIASMNDEFVEKIEDLKQIGLYVCQGIAEGIEDETNRLIALDAVGQLSQDIIDKAREVLGIESPSKEFIEIGEYIDDGMVTGVNNNLNDVTKAAKEMAETFITETTNTVNGYGEQFGSAVGNVITEGKDWISENVKMPVEFNFDEVDFGDWGAGLEDIFNVDADTSQLTDYTKELENIFAFEQPSVDVGSYLTGIVDDMKKEADPDNKGFFGWLGDKASDGLEWAGKGLTNAGQALASGASDAKNAVVDFFGNIFGGSKKESEQAIEGLTKSLDACAKSTTTLGAGTETAVTDMNSSMSYLLNNSLYLADTYTGHFVDMGKRLGDSMAYGIYYSDVDNVQSAVWVISQVMTSLNAFESDMEVVGNNLAIGLANGIVNSTAYVVAAAQYLANKTMESVNQAFGIASPSKVFAEVGMYNDLGLAEGFSGYSQVVTDAAKGVAIDSIDVVTDAMTAFDKMDFDNIDSFGFAPVSNFGNVRGRYDSMNDLFKMESPGFKMASKFANQGGNVGTFNDASVISAINDVNDRLDDLGNAISNMKVVMNSGALVGQIASDMDRRLGLNSRLRERGN